MAVTYRVPGAILTEREHSSRSTTRSPTARRSPSSRARSPRPTALDRPYLLFLQGGPGFEATRPTEPAVGLDEAGARRLPGAAPRPARHRPLHPGRRRSPGDTPQAQAAYLTHFRADSIVRDAELIRAELGVERWSVLGQSFGGFCVDDLPLVRARGPARGVHHRRPVADRPARRRRLRRDVRRGSSRRTGPTSSATRTTAHGSRDILRRLDDEDVRLPSGDRLTVAPLPPARPARSATAPASSSSTTCSSCRSARAAFLHDVEAGVRFARNPIYATLHESSLRRRRATRWSAARLLPDEVARASATSRPSTSSPGCGRTTAGCAAPRGGRAPRRARLAAPVRRRPARAATRSRSRRRSTSTTCTSSARSRRRRPAPIRGLRPWITNEYRAQRPARRRRARARPADRPRAGPRLSGEGAPAQALRRGPAAGGRPSGRWQLTR